MVQVDVFWAYGLGANLAWAAGRQLVKKDKPYESGYFVWTLLFLALVWAPTGSLLLFRHPSWETMQAAENLAAIPIFLTIGFGITNITQGILGFWIGLMLMQKGRYYLANLNWIFGYLGMLFILLYAWDGMGYDRFLYDRDMLPGSPAWTSGASTGATLAGALEAIPKFMTSSVAMTLYLDAVYLLIPLFYLTVVWYQTGLRQDGIQPPGGGKVLTTYLMAVFVVGLGAAAFCVVVVNYTGALLGVGEHMARGLGQIPANTGMHVLSYLIGLPLALGVLWFTVFKPGGLVHRLLAPLTLGDDPDKYRPSAKPALS